MVIVDVNVIRPQTFEAGIQFVHQVQATAALLVRIGEDDPGEEGLVRARIVRAEMAASSPP